MTLLSWENFARGETAFLVSFYAHTEGLRWVPVAESLSHRAGSGGSHPFQRGDYN